MVVPEPVPRRDRGTRAQRVAVAVLAAGLLAAGVYTLWNFLGALAWAGILAIALWPLYRAAQMRFGVGRGNVLLPGAFTLAVALVFIVPLGLFGVQLAREAHAAADWVRDVEQNGVAEPDLLRHLPFGQAQVDRWWQQNLAGPGDAADLVQRATRGRITAVGRTIGAQVLRRLTLFAFTLLTLFFLFRDGDALARQMRRAAIRTFGPGGERVGKQIIASVHGTVNGMVLVGLGEGAVLGVAYVVAGVPHPTAFGAMTVIAALIPFATPVVFSVAALLIVQQSVVWAVVVVGIGLAVTFIADHFVRPVLIGGATRLPFIWVLLGILGGVEMWGLLGLFIGPAVMAALMLLWREWAGERLE
jgi:predicted PurR-regulated permease PerM